MILPSAYVLDFSKWYDNEWGYSNRCVDLTVFIGKKLKASGQAVTEKTVARS